MYIPARSVKYYPYPYNVKKNPNFGFAYFGKILVFIGNMVMFQLSTKYPKAPSEVRDPYRIPSGVVVDGAAGGGHSF